MTGRIFDIQRFSIHDGPGIRTTVFLKGCTLRCKWCHNPEGIGANPQLSYTPEKCISCGACMTTCPENAIVKPAAARALVDRAGCNNCGKCAAVCDAQALTMVGRDASVEEVLEVVLRDRDYYRASGGGMTLSGGEPLMQPVFAAALLGAARQAGIHCCVETAGFVDWAAIEQVRPHVDLFLFDYKETDSALHKAFIGQPNEPILANLRRLHAAGSRILLRCPMIPEYNARREHLEGIAAISRDLPNLVGVELLAYHRLGKSKLKRLGLQDRMPESVKPPEPAAVSDWNRFLLGKGVRTVGGA